MDILSSATTLGAIVGLTQALKLAGLPKRFAPIASIALGLSAAYFFVGVNQMTTIAGVVLGLSAAGLWSGVKATAGK